MNRVFARRVLWGAALALPVFGLSLKWLAGGGPQLAPAPETAMGRDLRLFEANEMVLPIVPGEVFAQVMEKAGMESLETARLIADVRPVYDLGRIQSGQSLTLYFRDWAVAQFLLSDRRYPVSGSRALRRR